MDLEINFLDSKSSISAKISEQDQKKERIDFSVIEMSPEKKQILAMLFHDLIPPFDKFQHKEGIIDLKGTILIVDKKIDKISLNEIDLSHISYSYLPLIEDASFHSLIGDVVIDVNSEVPIVDGYLEVKEAQITTGKMLFDHINTTVKLENKKFFPSLPYRRLRYRA